MKNRKIILIVLIIIMLIATTIFLIWHYKNRKDGNTIVNKSEEEMIEDILNIKSYEAKLNVTV